MKHKFAPLALLVLMASALACGLGTTAAPPTLPPTPASIAPIALLGLNPVTGQVGQSVIVSAAGFPPNARVSLFVSPQNLPSTVPLTTLTTDDRGDLSFALQLPGQINNTPVTDNMPISFTLTAESGGSSANALFLVIGANGIPAATTAPVTGGNTGGATLFITSPGLYAAVGGSVVTVTGSGAAADNRVIVQVQDANNQVLGSTTAAIQAVAGSVGAWTATISFVAPTAQANGYIVALTNAEQSSIPITFSGTGAAAGQIFATAAPVQIIFATTTPG